MAPWMLFLEKHGTTNLRIVIPMCEELNLNVRDRCPSSYQGLWKASQESWKISYKSQ